jgi:hypothetical protein
MTLRKLIRDNFAVGILFGILCIGISYLIINSIRMFVISRTGDTATLKPPAVQLLCLMLNVLLFRIIMVNMQKENAGKGFLFITVMAALTYFFIFYRISR